VPLLVRFVRFSICARVLKPSHMSNISSFLHRCSREVFMYTNVSIIYHLSSIVLLFLLFHASLSESSSSESSDAPDPSSSESSSSSSASASVSSSESDSNASHSSKV